MGHPERLTEHIHFRTTAAHKEELMQLAEASGLSLGHIIRMATKTVEILFDEELTLARLIEYAGILKKDRTSVAREIDPESPSVVTDHIGP